MRANNTLAHNAVLNGKLLLAKISEARNFKQIPNLSKALQH